MAKTTNPLTAFIAAIKARFAGLDTLDTLEGLGDFRARLEGSLRAKLDEADAYLSKAVNTQRAKIDAVQRAANKAIDDAQSRAAVKSAEADAEYAAGRKRIKDAVDAEVNTIETTVRAAIRRAEALQTSGLAEKGAQEETVGKLREALAVLESI